MCINIKKHQISTLFLKRVNKQSKKPEQKNYYVKINNSSHVFKSDFTATEFYNRLRDPTSYQPI